MMLDSTYVDQGVCVKEKRTAGQHKYARKLSALDEGLAITAHS